MLRITLVSQKSDEVVLRVDGWLTGNDVDLLDREGRRHLAESRRVVLDLGGTRFIDQKGIMLLRSWSGDSLRLRGASPFVRTLLATHGLDQD